MRALDYLLRDWRYRIVERHVPMGCRIVDIGGFDGSLLMRLYNKIEKGVCIDPLIEEKRDSKIEFVRYRVTDKLPLPDSSFDVATMLAVYEHLGDSRELVASEIFRILRRGGVALLTVPDSAVDNILRALIKMRLIDGMSFEEHGHFDSSDTVSIFEKCGFKLRRRVKFQLGLNNLFVFEKGEALGQKSDGRESVQEAP